MLAVSVKDTKLTLLKQKTLAVHIISKIFVFILSNMIRLQIGEYTDIKRKSRYPVKHECLPHRGNARCSFIWRRRTLWDMTTSIAMILWR